MPPGRTLASEIGVGGMQRAGNDAVLLALGALAQIDEGHVRPADERHRLARAHRPAASRDLVLRETHAHVGGHGHIHHLRVGQLEVAHQLDIFVDRFHLQARIERLLLADGRDRLALVVVRREDHASRPAAAAAC